MKYPIKLSPCYKDYLWGGNGLKILYGKQSDLSVMAESWELSCHKNGQSTVAEGVHKGIKLVDILKSDQTMYIGTNLRTKDFPILVKFIDANQDLSIQVHPSDQNANKADGEHGKAELWYIVDCKPHSHIYYGFSQKVSPEEFRARAENGTICEVLNKVDVEKGDIYYILPGTVHALGAGIIAAEIQQNSDTTFRIFDYNRRDRNGKLRDLRLKRASEVLCYEPVIPENCRVNNQAYFEEFSIFEMFRCEYFKAFRLDVYRKATLQCDISSFQHLLFVEGTGTINYDGKMYPFSGGSSYYLPAGLGEYIIQGRCRALLSCT